MFPWVYGFEWNAGYLIFVSLFLLVAVVVAATVGLALFRTVRDFLTGRDGLLRWEAQFHELTPADRACRHALTGELPRRVCHQSFDCGRCPMHEKLATRAAWNLTPAEEEIFGMPVPLDRLYHRGHTWVLPEPDGTLRIGLDELGSRLLGRPDRVELPVPGARIQANVPAFRLFKNGAPVQVLAPVDGEVIETAPPSAGWLVRVKPAASTSLAHLLRPHEVKPWYLRELERLQLALTPLGAAPALADGGVLAPDLASACPPRQWDAACGAVFLDV